MLALARRGAAERLEGDRQGGVRGDPKSAWRRPPSWWERRPWGLHLQTVLLARSGRRPELAHLQARLTQRQAPPGPRAPVSLERPWLRLNRSPGPLRSAPQRRPRRQARPSSTSRPSWPAPPAACRGSSPRVRPCGEPGPRKHRREMRSDSSRHSPGRCRDRCTPCWSGRAPSPARTPVALPRRSVRFRVV